MRIEAKTRDEGHGILRERLHDRVDAAASRLVVLIDSRQAILGGPVTDVLMELAPNLALTQKKFAVGHGKVKRNGRGEEDVARLQAATLLVGCCRAGTVVFDRHPRIAVSLLET